MSKNSKLGKKLTEGKDSDGDHRMACAYCQQTFPLAGAKANHRHKDKSTGPLWRILRHSLYPGYQVIAWLRQTLYIFTEKQEYDSSLPKKPLLLLIDI